MDRGQGPGIKLIPAGRTGEGETSNKESRTPKKRPRAVSWKFQGGPAGEKWGVTGAVNIQNSKLI